MAQFNSLIVTGNSRFLNPINGNARNGVYYVKGTQTATTGSWTGAIPIPALYDGLTIMYYLPYNGSGNATLNLTLSNGTTTGAVNCYYNGAYRLTTHYGAGSNIVMTYYSAGSISIGGTATTDNRWIANANYDTNSNDQAYNVRNHYNYFVAGANKIFPYTFIMQNADGRWESIVTSSSTGTSKARNTHGFRLGQIALMYANATYAENAKVGDANIWYQYTYSVIDHRYSFNTANDATNGLTAGKPIYLVGALGNDGLFYLDATWWTQTLPTTADGKLYIYLGDAWDYYRMAYAVKNPIYCYTNGMIRQFAQDCATVNGVDISTKMDKVDPTGTGSLSLNRRFNTTIGDYSVAEGYGTAATNIAAHAEGQDTFASGSAAHAEGYLTNASNHYSHAEGASTTASGMLSHAEGGGTTASGDYSHVEGLFTTAAGDSQHAGGKYNIVDNDNTYAEIIGNGTADNARSNARTLDWQGNETLAGDLVINGNQSVTQAISTISVTISASGWTEDTTNNYWYNDVTVSGVTASDNYEIVGFTPSSTFSDNDNIKNQLGCVTYGVTSTDNIRFIASWQCPIINISIILRKVM